MTDKTRFFTPQYILDAVEEMGPIVLDPCADPHSRVNAQRAIMLPKMAAELNASPEELEQAGIVVGDGLQIDWRSFPNIHGVVFVNPPYGRSHNEAWAEKIWNSWRANQDTIVLVPASVGVGWWEDYWKAEAICFVRGRIRFDHLTEGQEGQAGTFDSALCYFGANKEKFKSVFSKLGKVVFP